MNRKIILLSFSAILMFVVGPVSAQVELPSKPPISSLSTSQIRKLVPVAPADSGSLVTVKMATLRKAPAVAPTYPGGDDSLMAFLSRNIQYPGDAANKAISGTVLVGLVIDSTGSISDIRLRKDIGGGCGAEAVRVVSLMPRWSPARDAQGYPMLSETLVSVKFQMDNLPPDDVNLDPNHPDDHEGDFDF